MELSRTLYEALVREHAHALDLFLRAICRGDSAEADEVFQETLIVAWKRLPDFEPDRPFGPWLRGIARVVLLAHTRRARGRAGLSGADLESAADAAEARLHSLESLRGDDFEERLEHVRDCLKQLPGRMQEAVRLRYHESLGAEALSQRLGQSQAAARKTLERARRRLAECVMTKAAGRLDSMGGRA